MAGCGGVCHVLAYHSAQRSRSDTGCSTQLHLYAATCVCVCVWLALYIFGSVFRSIFIWVHSRALQSVIPATPPPSPSEIAADLPVCHWRLSYCHVIFANWIVRFRFAIDSYLLLPIDSSIFHCALATYLRTKWDFGFTFASKTSTHSHQLMVFVHSIQIAIHSAQFIHVQLRDMSSLWRQLTNQCKLHSVHVKSVEILLELLCMRMSNIKFDSLQKCLIYRNSNNNWTSVFESDEQKFMRAKWKQIRKKFTTQLDGLN